MRVILVIIFCFVFSKVFGSEPQWLEGEAYPINGLSNPYDLSQMDLEHSIRQGRLHSLHYPVSVTGIKVPLQPMETALGAESDSRFKRWIQKLMRKVTHWNSFDDLTEWLGLHAYPNVEGEGPYFVPFKGSEKPEYRMGVTVIEDARHAIGFTYSCAACHTNKIFGKTIVGLSNRFPRANELFVLGKKAFNNVPAFGFKWATDATHDEKLMYKRSKKNIQFVEAKSPTYLGLDTSLAHVALSLSHRKQDAYATKKREKIRNSRPGGPPFKWAPPRVEKLRSFVADSKPGVWWNVKYKNRWLLDGSVVSGNPILTNLLWNEIGRGTDLHELEKWIEDNRDGVIKDLTTAVFNAPAPKLQDFVDINFFNIQRAKNGQALFNQSCSRCHGTYKKAWELQEAWQLEPEEKLETIEVSYPSQTPVKNVGTDPQRWQGMVSLEALNELEISKKYGIKVKAQRGYVPPPLVGIWARWPYFHNNSIPNLCALFSPENLRPKSYYAGHANDPDTDFDWECNGYPLGDKTPESWKTEELKFDSSLPGMSNQGHYSRIFVDAEGGEKFTPQEKRDLIHFLQTL